MKKYFWIFIFTGLFILIFYKAHRPLQTSQEKKDHFFVFVVSAYNSENILEKTLLSILNQTYQNFKIIYIDDGSVDQTEKIVKTFIEKNDKEKKIDFFYFEKHKGLLERAYSAALNTADDEIVVFLDERAYLKDKTILEQINDNFKNFDIWLLYGSSINDKTNRLEKAKRVYSSNLFTTSARDAFWKPCLFKAFYSSLLKKVRLEDFFFRGKFTSSSFDSSYMFAMLEMASNHTKCISKALCHYYPKEQILLPCDKAKIKCMRKIRLSQSYEALNSLKKEEHRKKADLIIFSYHRPLQLYALLESTEKYVKDLQNISVIYRSDVEKFTKAYEKVNQRFPTVRFIMQTHPKEDFRPLLLETIQRSNDYIIFAVDDILFKDYVDISHCLDYLEKTKSYFFSLRLGDHITYHYMGDYPQPIPHHIMLPNSVMGWHIDAAKGDWYYPTSVDVTIYRKEDILQDLTSFSFHNPNSLEINWFEFYKKKHLKKDRYRTGLCYTKSKAVNLPFNLVNVSENRNMDIFDVEMLLQKFNEDYLLDISLVEKMENPSVHIEVEPRFFKK